MASAVDGDGIIAVITVVVVCLVVFITCRFGCRKDAAADNLTPRDPSSSSTEPIGVQVVKQDTGTALRSVQAAEEQGRNQTASAGPAHVAIAVNLAPEAGVRDWPQAGTPSSARAGPYVGVYPQFSPRSPPLQPEGGVGGAGHAVAPSERTPGPRMPDSGLPPLSPHAPSAVGPRASPPAPSPAPATAQAQLSTPGTRTPVRTPASGARGKANKYDYRPLEPQHGLSRPQRVYIRISGIDRERALVESTLTDLVRDKGIYKRRGEVQRRHGEGAYYLRSHAYAAARAAFAHGDSSMTPSRSPSPAPLSPAPPVALAFSPPRHENVGGISSPLAAQAGHTPGGKAEKIDVEHTWECRMLGHAIVQTPEYHVGQDGTKGLLAQVNLEGSSRTQQPMVVQNAINPLYAVHNCCDDPTLFNLKLMEHSLNVVKTNVIDAWISHRYMLAEGTNCARDAEQLDIVGAYRVAYREHMTRRRASLPPLSPADVEELASTLGAELKAVQEPYCSRLDDRAAALRHAGTHIHARINDSNRLQGLCESIKMMEEELGL